MVMTLAVYRALKAYDRDCNQAQALQNFKKALIDAMRTLGRAYPRVGYGRKFIWWLFGDHPAPYGSLTGGSAMRVSFD